MEKFVDDIMDYMRSVFVPFFITSFSFVVIIAVVGCVLLMAEFFFPNNVTIKNESNRRIKMICWYEGCSMYCEETEEANEDK